MIYLTNDDHDQAVYFDLRRSEPHRRAGTIEHHYYGLLGNGVCEVAVEVRRGRNGVEVAFGRGGCSSSWRKVLSAGWWVTRCLRSIERAGRSAESGVAMWATMNRVTKQG